jgi:hypothetical protein
MRFFMDAIRALPAVQPCEIEVLNTAAFLLKYAAESPKKLPNSIVLPISIAAA